MASTYSNLKIQLMATGENSGTWGNVTNDNLGVAIEQALVETATVTFASANVTLNLTNTNAAQDARALRLNLTGTTGGARDLIVPAIQKPYIVNNGTADTITVKVSGQTGVAVPAGRSYLLYNNGTDVVNGLEGISVASGGTGLETLTAESVVIGNGTDAVKFVAPGASSNVLTSNGSGWVSQAAATTTNASALTTGITAVNVGGTGATTLNAEAVIIGNSTDAVKFVSPGTTGNVLTSNGTVWLSQAVAAAAGGLSGIQQFNSPSTFTPPPSTNSIIVYGLGGGGGGGGGRVGAETSTGGRGGFGGLGVKQVAVTGGTPYPVTVGSGGNGGAGGNQGTGGAGGSTSYGSPSLFTVNGGSGGPGGPPGPGTAPAAADGNAPGATVTLPGGPAAGMFSNGGSGGPGGPSNAPGNPGGAGSMLILF